MLKEFNQSARLHIGPKESTLVVLACTENCNSLGCVPNVGNLHIRLGGPCVLSNFVHSKETLSPRAFKCSKLDGYSLASPLISTKVS
jgi:hypothetical protein